MNMREGILFPGSNNNLVPYQIERRRDDYVKALREADKGDIIPMQKLLRECFFRQTNIFYEKTDLLI